MLKPVRRILETLEKVSGRIPKWTDALAATITLFNLMDLGIFVFFGKDVKDTQVATALSDLDKLAAATCSTLEYVPIRTGSSAKMTER